MIRTLWILVALTGVLGLGNADSRAQVVAVTLKLDKPSITVGEATTLHAYAQIVPSQRATADRIFSWHVDVLNETGAVAKLNGGALSRPSSDKDPATSSSGVDDGAHRRGIYDTFLNLAGAGKDSPVELFSVPVTGLSLGRTTFRIAAGSAVDGLGTDFLVAPAGAGEPLVGGDYSTATASLDVTAGSSPGPSLGISASSQPGGQGLLVTLQFPVASGSSHFVEFRNSLGADATWQPLPGAPHNSGFAVDSANVPARFYRLRVTTP